MEIRWIKCFWDCLLENSVVIIEIYVLSHIFWQKFREINVFDKEITKELIWRNIFRQE